MAPNSPRSPSERAAARLAALLAGGWTYSRLAARLSSPAAKVSTGAVWRMVRGREPRAAPVRAAFGLPPKVGSGTQYVVILYCRTGSCRKAFVPNHPLRRRCYECAPPKKRSRRK